jgi:hypothetical protein
MHPGLLDDYNLLLNSTAGAYTASQNSGRLTALYATTFTVNSSGGSLADVNASGGTYVAYLFASDAGGFGTAGTDSVIKCGTFSGTGFVNVGWEPQWIMIKPYDQVYNWEIYDNMRGMGQPAGASAGQVLRPNTTGAEAGSSGISFEATGFTQTTFGGSYPCVYIAIRRGPMKTPTVGTAVFSASTASTGNNTPGFVTDNLWTFYRDGTSSNTAIRSRLQGNTPYLVTSSTGAEATGSNYKWDTNNGVNYTWGSPYIGYYFRRAPGFFDVVAYTGTSSARTIAHNLGVTPELLIVKSRSSGVSNRGWFTYIPLVHTVNQYLELQRDVQTLSSSGIWYTGVTSSVFAVNTDVVTNNASETYIAYLFASCPGVSKVGSYTGNGTTQTIDCGFTGGARFVLIKRTDATGDWYVYDTARGMTVMTDPYLLLNNSAAEVATLGSVTTVSTGFALNSTILAAINISAGTYIFLALS